MDFSIHFTFVVIILMNFAGFLVAVKCDFHTIITCNTAIPANYEFFGKYYCNYETTILNMHHSHLSQSPSPFNTYTLQLSSWFRNWEMVRMCISQIYDKSFSRKLRQLRKKIDGLFYLLTIDHEREGRNVRNVRIP